MPDPVGISLRRGKSAFQPPKSALPTSKIYGKSDTWIALAGSAGRRISGRKTRSAADWQEKSPARLFACLCIWHGPHFDNLYCHTHLLCKCRPESPQGGRQHRRPRNRKGDTPAMLPESGGRDDCPIQTFERRLGLGWPVGLPQIDDGISSRSWWASVSTSR